MSDLKKEQRLTEILKNEMPYKVKIEFESIKTKRVYKYEAEKTQKATNSFIDECIKDVEEQERYFISCFEKAAMRVLKLEE